MQPHDKTPPGDPYDEPLAYEIAYSFRDIAAECDFLQAVCLKRLGHAPRSAAELGAGPGQHSRELASRGVRAYAVDRSPGVLAYLRQVAPEVAAVAGDLRDFQLPEPVEVVFCPLGTMAYLIGDEEWQRSLAAVARALLPGGVMVLEFVPGDAHKTEALSWTMLRDGLTVEATAGPLHSDQPGVYAWEMHLRLRSSSGERHYRGVQVQREVTAALAERLVRATGEFGRIELFGDWDVRHRWRGDPTVVLVASRR